MSKNEPLHKLLNFSDQHSYRNLVNKPDADLAAKKGATL